MKNLRLTSVLLFGMLAGSLRADPAVVFNEIMYHPYTNEVSLEWVELYNQMAVDMDISNWSIDDGIQYTFPEGTVINGRSYLVVAVSPATLMGATGRTNILGPFTGRLSNTGEKLELKNNNGRVVDEVTYGVDGEWPVGPDGAGISLAKSEPDTASDMAANWRMSAQIGGTPGFLNFPSSKITLSNANAFLVESGWKYDNSGNDLGTTWRTAGFNDGGWLSGNALFYAGGGQSQAGQVQPIPTLFSTGLNSNGVVLAAGALDPHYTLIAAAQGGTPPFAATVEANHSAWLANDATSSWIGVISQGANNVAQGVYTFRTRFDLTGFDPATAQITIYMAADNAVDNVTLNGAALGLTFTGFAGFGGPYTVSSGFVAGTNTLDFITSNAGTAASPGGFRAVLSGTAKKIYNKNTQLTAGGTTTYFRKSFVVPNDPSVTGLTLGSILDDGAVFYLNGTEILRQNMPAGTVTAATFATTNVVNANYNGPIALPTGSLVPGTNVLAVEVHQAVTGIDDLLFGADLLVTTTNFPPTPPPTLALNEVSSVTNGQFWVELINYGPDTVTANNSVLARFGNTNSFEYVIPSLTLPPGGRFVLDKAILGFGADNGDRVVLYGPNKTNVLDALLAKNSPRARWPEGTGEWLRPDVITPGASNSVALHNEVVINEIMYHQRSLPAVPEVRYTNVLVTMTNFWSYNQNGVDLGTDWRSPFYDDSAWAYSKALFYTNFPGALPAAKNTVLFGSINGVRTPTYYFRTAFVFTNTTDGLVLSLRHIVDDAAVFYLNGEEVYRYNINANPVYYTNSASLGVGTPTNSVPFTLSISNLVMGTNILAVEVHQQLSPPSSDIAFGAELTVSGTISPALPARESPESWVELYNRGTNAVDLTGWSFDKGITYNFPTGTTLLPGSYLVVAQDATYLNALHPGLSAIGPFTGSLSKSGESIVLKDAEGNPANRVRYYDSSPWPSFADGFGSSLELRDPWADNSRPEAWADSDEGLKSQWQTYSYRGVAAAEPAGSPTNWNELVFGLLGESDVLLDDFSIIEAPNGARKQLLQNGKFDAGLAAWRFIGNHRQAEVLDDPTTPGNKVLHLVTKGDTEHMHNHVESTYTNNFPITNGVEYEISFRAKWLGGVNKLNTRLYFNRLAKTTDLLLPATSGTPGARNSRYATNLGPTFVSFQHTPVVPGPTDPVRVSVDSSDAQGISSANLRYNVNGGLWQTLPMTMTPQFGSVHLEAIVPALAANSLVQFYVEATDGLGAKATYPAGGTNSRALYEVVSNVAYNTRLHSIRILMPAADTGFMHASTNVMSNESLPCTVITDESRVFYNAAVHLQGSERGRDNSSRVGFSVKLPADNLYRGVLDGFTIDRSGGYSGLGGKHDEILLKHAINKVGGLPGMYDDLVQVFAPRNQEDGTGLMILEKYNSSFLDSAFKNGGDGETYKLELIYYPTTTANGDSQGIKLPQPDGVIGTDIKDLGTDKEAYRWNLLKDNHVSDDNYAPMINLARTLSQTGSALQTNLPKVMDIDEWTRAVAFLSLIGGDDIYTYGNSHNLIIYFRPEDLKGMAFLWDLDYSFVAAVNKAFPGNGNATTYNFIVSIPENFRRYYSHLLDLSNLTGNSAYMTEWANRYAGMVGQNWSGAVNYLAQRAAYVRSQLPLTTAFNITVNGGNNFSTTNSFVNLSGTAPLTVENIQINGATYPVTWTSINTWVMNVPLTAVTNQLVLFGVDRKGNVLPTVTDSITITNTGLVAPVPVVINEWMASNSGPGGYPDPQDGVYQDWFELYNPNIVSVNLSGFYLTDDPAVSTKFQIPVGTVIAPQGFLLVWADNQTNQNATSTNGDLHVNFALSGSGEILSLYSTNGTLQHTVTFGAQAQNVSQGYYPDGNTNSMSSMSNWTPRSANTLNPPTVPGFSSYSMSPSGTLSFTFATTPNRNYRVEYKDNLNAPTWAPLTTIRATGNSASGSDATPGLAQRFYRILLLP